MAQFDVYRVRGGGMVVDGQSDLLLDLPTRFVIPLRVKDDSVLGRLTPILRVGDRDYTMVTPLAGAIDVRDIEHTVISLIAYEYEIKGALDMLISGF